jgi:hypothetical protein
MNNNNTNNSNNNKLILRHPYNKELKLHYNRHYEGYAVMEQKGALIEPYLESLYQTLQKALNQYAKVYAFRIDLRFPNDPNTIYKADTLVITRFIDSFKAKIRHNRNIAKSNGNYHDTEVRYVWVKEASQDGSVHYHFIFFLNGNAFRAMGDFDSDNSNMYNRLQSAWVSALGIYDCQAHGLVHVSNWQWLIASQADRERWNESNDVFYAASYLCKAATKNYGDGSKWFGCSRL